MAKTYCRLDNGKVVSYIAAFPVYSTATVSPKLTLLGEGIIIRVGDKKYYGKTRLKFYTTIKRIKKHGKRKN